MHSAATDLGLHCLPNTEEGYLQNLDWVIDEWSKFLVLQMHIPTKVCVLLCSLLPCPTMEPGLPLFSICEYNGGIYQHKWIHCIKKILISVGRVDLLNKEVIENPKLIKMQISKTLSDLYIQQWYTKVSSSS